MEAEEMMDGDGDGESSLYCRLHPAQSVVGICSACLQEKLGKLVFAERQSMFSNQEHHTSDHHHHNHNHNHIPPTKQANHEECKTNTTTTTTANNSAGIGGGIPNGNGRSRMLLNKSKSVAASSRRVVALQVTNTSSNNSKKKVSGSSSSSSAYPHSNAFWSFFSFGKKKHHPNGNDSGLCASTSQRVDQLEVTGKLVTRSRSVGFGSRSFSADIYHRSPPVLAKKQEGRPQDEDEEDNGEYHNGNHHHHQNHNHGNVRCGGLFVGFGGMQSCDAGKDDDGCDKASSGCHSRSKSWGWAFSSPLRAFIHSSRRWTNKDSSNVSTITAQPPSSNGDSALEIDRG